MVDLDKPKPDQAEPEQEQKPKAGLKFLTRILLLVGILLFQVAAAYFGIQYLFFNKQVASAESKTAAAVTEGVGPIFELGELVVNPAESLGRRFVVVKIALELTNETVKKTVETQAPLINDEMIRILASKNVEFLSNIAERDSLREEMRLAINDQLPGGNGVKKVFFAGFVLQ